LAKIEDPDIARGILDKVNAFNLETGLKVGVPVSFFALLPQSTSVPLVLSALALGALYVAKDKFPQSSG
jgi:hypothetical protein